MNKVFLNMASGHRMSGAVSTLPKSVTQGWNYQPGTYRCDRGWNDETGKSYGCREPGARDVNGEWLCHMHADEVPDPTETVYRTCPLHRAMFDLPPRSGAPGQWYWCSPKNHEPHEWQEEGRSPYDRIPWNDIFVAMLWVLYITGLFFALLFCAVLWISSHTRISADATLWCAVLLTIPSWFIALWINSQVFSMTMHAAEQAWHFIWGDPL